MRSIHRSLSHLCGRIEAILAASRAARSSVRRPARHRVAASIQALECRLLLSSTATAVDASASTVQDVAKSGGAVSDFSYHRHGGKLDLVATQAGLGGVALQGGPRDVEEGFLWMIEQMGGTQQIKGDFLVLTASNDFSYNKSVYKLGGMNSVATLQIPSRAAASESAVLEIIQKAEAIFITGGAQDNYLNFWSGTPVQSAIAAKIAEGAPIGGTSAGTAVMGQFIYSALNGSVTSTAALANPYNTNMTFDQNFISSQQTLPLLNNTLLDTHFTIRDRIGRMTAFLARVATDGMSPNGQPRGIGINEETALLISADGQSRVVGNTKAKSPPQVEFFWTPGLPEVCKPNTPLTYHSIQVERVLPGGTFNLADWDGSWQINNPYTTRYTVSVDAGVLTTQAATAATLNDNIALYASLFGSVGTTADVTDGPGGIASAIGKRRLRV